jgi:hypothetical protein
MRIAESKVNNSSAHSAKGKEHSAERRLYLFSLEDKRFHV